MQLLFVDDNYQVDGQHYCRRLGSQATSLRSQEIIEVMHPETGTSRIIRECLIHPCKSLMQAFEPSPVSTNVHGGTFVFRYKSSRLDRRLPVQRFTVEYLPSGTKADDGTFAFRYKGSKVDGGTFAFRYKSSRCVLCFPGQKLTVEPLSSGTTVHWWKVYMFTSKSFRTQSPCSSSFCIFLSEAFSA